ncbi:hypothetical protein SAMN04487914_13722 [Arthrobacter sp. ok909]|uniref:hypothetical protein n=1 Tax=Arthrobacter sp. ok909 TaxID=1761746 RepID=UPI000881CDFD|nr:hypothetical protein [Arthrobacter sp. ok909]SDP77264.1 hypothetical protein SAMN04487914_13722 [Arthrobacter sp. ok909]
MGPSAAFSGARSSTATSDAIDPAFVGDHGLASFGFWNPCGSWTSANGRTGVVPKEVAVDYGDADVIAKPVDHGMWRETAVGYALLRGPSTDFPMPLWRNGDKPDDGRLISIDRDSQR